MENPIKIDLGGPFQIFFREITPNLGEMIQFDLRFFFQMAW